MSCPICEAETVRTFRPFCSKRCADLDLAKWLNGAYSLPSAAPEDQDVDVSTEEKAPERPH